MTIDLVLDVKSALCVVEFYHNFCDASLASIERFNAHKWTNKSMEPIALIVKRPASAVLATVGQTVSAPNLTVLLLGPRLLFFSYFCSDYCTLICKFLTHLFRICGFSNEKRHRKSCSGYYVRE